MSSKSWHISRRRMLKGVGVCIALPFLEAMIPSTLSAKSFFEKQRPLRTAFLYLPNGVHPDLWSPEGVGRNFKLSPILQPLAPVKDDLLVLGNLYNRNSDTKQDGHYTKTANFLTCQKIQKTTGSDVNAGGTSADQLMAGHIGKDTAFPSLEYALDGFKSGVDVNVGFTRLYGSAISWRSATQPNPREIEPRQAFDRLFRNLVPGKPPKVESPWKRSVLDIVKEDAASVKRNLGASDQNKLSEYMEAIRAIELRIENTPDLRDFEARLPKEVKQEILRMDERIEDYIELTEGIDITEKTRLLLDIIVLAFWSDISRVSTFMFGNSVSTRNFSFLPGVNGNHHSISHHGNIPEMMKQYEIITRWHIEQYGYLLERLKAIPEGDGTLLDHSMVLFGAGLRDGNRHSPVNLPIVIAGSGGGALKTGRNINFPEKTPLANLYLTMMNVLGMETESFADATGELCELYG
ncbi:MAG: DUF1552 domain-containing protein [Bacteroidia bacterium]|nr:DUF1552 domain-containing protein [Bacteroidia bacterium]